MYENLVQHSKDLMIVIDGSCVRMAMQCSETRFIITFPRPIQFGDASSPLQNELGRLPSSGSYFPRSASYRFETFQRDEAIGKLTKTRR